MTLKEQGFFSNYLDRLENLNKHLSQEIQGLPQTALDWSPGPETNSLAVLLAHIAGSLRYWIGDVALEQPSGRVREQEFQTRGLGAEALQRRLDEVVVYARLNLPRLSLADLDQKRQPGRGEEMVTCGWALLHALEHGYLHLGHVELTRQLWENQVSSRR
jgi:uncharacterized damage-inducible protein DinB